MIRFPRRAAGLLLTLALIGPGCEAPLPSSPPEPADTGSAWNAWRDIAARGQADWDVERAVALTTEMAAEPDGLAPMLAMVADESAPAHVKVLIVMCLTQNREALPPYAPTLTAMVSPERPSRVRAFGAHILGLLDSEKAADTVAGLLDDEDRAVREAAVGVLVAMHGDRVAGRLREVWHDPETSTSIREQIILGMAPELVEDQLPLYAEALLDHGLNAAVRYKAATVLGQTGGASHIGLLEKCKETDPDPYVREQAGGGLALLKARHGEAAGQSPESGT